ncbi:MAG: TonB-dependent receptor [Flavobacteriales bacterium]
MKKQILSILSSSLLIGNSIAFSVPKVDSSKAMNDTSLILKPIKVEGVRMKLKKEDLPQSINLIKEKDIKSTLGNEVTDIIKKQSSVNVIQYPNLLSGVGIRGFRPQVFGLNQRTQLLVNGRPAGSSNLSLLNYSNAKQIEVIKGATSALYGSQAMGGTINIVPKKSKGAIKTNIIAEISSFKTYRSGFHTGGSITKKLDFDLDFSYFSRNDNFEFGGDNIFRDAMGNDKAKLLFKGGDSTATI